MAKRKSRIGKWLEVIDQLPNFGACNTIEYSSKFAGCVHELMGVWVRVWVGALSGRVGGKVGWQDRKRKGGQLGGVLKEKMHG